MYVLYWYSEGCLQVPWQSIVTQIRLFSMTTVKGKGPVLAISPSESYKLLDVPGKNCDKQKVLTHCMRNGKDCIVLYETQTTVGLINKMELSRILS